MRWAAVVAWMAVIFLLSAQAGEESSSLSGSVLAAVVAGLDWVARALGLDGVPGGLLDGLHLVVRKAAHFLAYLVLGALAFRAFAGSAGRTAEPGVAVVAEPGDPAGVASGPPWRAAGLALLISVAYAASDEFHQTFIPGRGGVATDVLIDAVGALAGVLLALWWRGREARAA